MPRPSYNEQIIQYMAAYPGKDISADEIAKAYGWANYQASSRLANVRSTVMGSKVIKEGSRVGLWKYVPTEEELGKEAYPEVKELLPPSPKTYVGFEQITVTVVKECDGEMVVVDDN